MSIGSVVSGALGGQNDFHDDAFKSDDNKWQYGGQAGGAASREGQLSQMGANGASTNGQQPYQAAQLGALGMAQQQANGNDFGAVQAQLQSGLAQSQGAAAAQAAGARGGGANLAAAQNQAGNTAGAMAASAGNNAAALKAQMQNQGIQNYAGQASQGLGMAQSQNQFNANLRQGYEGMNNQVAQSQLGAQMGQQQFDASNYNTAQAVNANVASGNAAQAGAAGSAVGGAAMSAASSALSSSDARAKMDIAPQTAGGGSGVKPGGGDMFNAATYTQSGGNPVGEAMLAKRDAGTANFAQLGGGMGNWLNASTAQPWSPESDAAKSNLDHFMGMDSGHAGVGQSPNSYSLSDTRAKKDAIFQAGAKAGALAATPNDSPNAADQFMASAAPATYRYKDPSVNGGEQRLGPMAQGLERGPTGRDIVKDTPHGKMVDNAALGLATAGATGRLHERLSALEGHMDPLNRQVMESEERSGGDQAAAVDAARRKALALGFGPQDTRAAEADATRRDQGAALGARMMQAGSSGPKVMHALHIAQQAGFSPEETHQAVLDAGGGTLGDRANQRLAQWNQ